MAVKGLVRGAFAAVAVGGAVFFTQFADKNEAEAKSPQPCAVNIKPSDMTKIKETHLAGATIVNQAIAKHKLDMAEIDPGISEQTAAEKMKFLDETYGKFAEQGLIDSSEQLWRDIREGNHIAGIAQINAEHEARHNLPCGPTGPQIPGNHR